MNKCRAPKIPPLLVNNVFIFNCREKAKMFNEFFSNQCMLITNSSVLPIFNFLADKRIDQVSIRKDVIVALVRNLNPNKASGSDGIYGQMLILSDDSVGMPLKILVTSYTLIRGSLLMRRQFLKQGISNPLITIGQYHYSQFVVTFLK